MAESESALLRRFVRVGDPEAFTEIVHRYAGLVYGTCLRVLANTDQAADATQETFFQLVKRAGEIRGSLAAWLHRVAVHKAVDSMRTNSTRRQREERYAEGRSAEDHSWQELSPLVDEALNQLDGSTRELLIRHYLEGKSMTDLALELYISRPTISRQIDSGLARLRAHLQKHGVLVTAACLSTLLTENTVRSAPAVVLGQVGKIVVMAGAGGTSVPVILSSSLAAVAKLKVVIAVAVVVAGAGLIVHTSFLPKRPDTTPGPPATAHENTGPSDSQAIRPSAQPTEQEAESKMWEQRVEEEAPPTRTDSAVPVAATPEVAGGLPVAPEAPPTSNPDEFRLDLDRPEATVRSFTRAMISGDAESVLACFLPGGTDYEDIQEILHADPGDPEQRREYEMRLWLQSFDPDAEMPIVSVEETEQGTSVTWQVTFKRDFTVKGQTFRAGDTFNLDARLRKLGNSWLIDAI